MLILFLPVKAQVNLFAEGSYGPQKMMLAIHGEKVFNPLVQLGIYAKTGSLNEYIYRDVEYLLDEYGYYIPTTEVHDFPYAHDPPKEANDLPNITGLADLIAARTRTNGWGVGSYLNLSRELGRYAKDWFFFRFSVEYLFLADQYQLYWGSPETGLTNAVEQCGTYRFDAIGCASRAGYKRFIDKDDRFFMLANLGVSWYKPFYRDGFSNGGSNYGFSAPFVGVEFIGGLGLGYSFIRKPH